jgi:hypothetical protein
MALSVRKGAEAFQGGVYQMTQEDRDAAIEAMFDGILAAYSATAPEDNDQFTDCRTFAHAALAALEWGGFMIKRRVAERMPQTFAP